MLLPVAIRNYSVGGGFYLTTSQFGSNLYIGNHAGCRWHLLVDSIRPRRAGIRAPGCDRGGRAGPWPHAHAVGSVLATGPSRAIGFITSQPGEWLALTGRKIGLLVNRSEMLDTESQESYAEWSWPLRIGGWIGHFGVLVPLAVLGRDRDLARAAPPVDSLRPGARLRRQRGDVLRVRALSLSARAVPAVVCGDTLRFKGARAPRAPSHSGFASAPARSGIRERDRARELAALIADAHDGDYRKQSRYRVAGSKAL